MKLLLSLLFPLVLFSQAKPYDTIYGKVKSVREKMVFMDSLRQTYKLFSDEGDYGHHGFMSRDFTLSRNYTFWYSLPHVHYINYLRDYDTIGRIAKETWYYKYNDVVTFYEFKHDEKDRIIEEKKINSDLESYSVQRWGYDYKDKLISTVKMYLGSDTGYWFEGYTYDNPGNLIETVRFSEHEKIRIETHEYENNKVVKTYHANRPPFTNQQSRAWKPWLRFEYEYDKNGNVIIFKDYSGSFEKEGLPPVISTSTYDSANNLVERSNNDDNLFTQKLRYNDQNQLIEEINFVNGKISISSKFFYKDGRLVKLLFKERGYKYNITFDYKLDSKSNWVEQSKSVNGKKLYVRRRDIKYWE